MGMIIQNGKIFSGEPKTTYKERVLWNGPATPPNSGTVITLTDAISNYDEIVFKIDKYQNTYAGESAFTVSLLTIGDQYISTVYTGSYQGAYWDYLSDTSINIRSTSSTVLQTYVKIIGIKYGDTVKRKDYHVYSTEEQIVGEWIDGRTVYEKTIPLQSAIRIIANTWTDLVDVSSLNISALVGSIAQVDPQPNSLSIMSPYLQVTNGVLRGFLPFSWTVSLITIRYTKSSI